MMQRSHAVANTAVPRRYNDPLGCIEHGLGYLEAAQAPAASPWAGSWPATMHELRRARIDYNCFATCLVCICLAPLTTHPSLPPEMQTRARQLVRRGAAFISSCGAAAPPGAYRFWRAADHPQPGPDLDDTALAHVALYAADAADALGQLDALQLFTPYRARRGTAIHPISAWAGRHPGVFAVWMDDAPVVVDACACANVVHCLCSAGARDVPGYRETVAMLVRLLGGHIPAWQCAPYYQSAAALAWCCTLIPLPGYRPLPEEVALIKTRRQLAGAMVHRTVPTVYDALLRISAAQQCGIDPPEPTLRWVYRQQAADGGWSAGRICCDRYDYPCWTSSAVTTALALRTVSATTE